MKNAAAAAASRFGGARAHMVDGGWKTMRRKKMRMKALAFVLGAAGLSAALLSGCSVEVSPGGAGKKEGAAGKKEEAAGKKAEAAGKKADAAGEEGKIDAAEKLRRETDRRRAEIERDYSASNSPALYATHPMAWFDEQDKRLRLTRQRLISAQGRINVIYGRYGRQSGDGGGKAAGYGKLLEQAEKVRAEAKTNGYPVAFAQWVIRNEGELDEKIAEIERAKAKNRLHTAQDTAIFNKACESRRKSREILGRFDEAYGKFNRVWDMVKLSRLSGIPRDLEKEINEIVDITDVFVNEWNKVE